MKQRFDSLSALMDHGFDTVIDVRSPAEYAHDHLPGAINLPVLSDDERAQVGTVYKQTSPFAARRMGAALVAQNAARHIAGPLAGKDGSWRPLVYCWRGGQRSGSFATILAQVGWRVGLIDGGYQSWRRLVHTQLYDARLAAPPVLIDGLTGTAKTAILNRLAARGHQVIDLEALARHRGSLLGARPEGQPSQKAFETALAAQIARLDKARPLLLEAESNKIGALHIPPILWEPMKTAPRIELHAPLEARAAYLSVTYRDVIANPAHLRARLDQLRELRGAESHDKWIAQLDAGDHRSLAASLMELHYDPSYRKSRASHDRPLLGRAHSAALDDQGQEKLTDQVEALLSRSAA